MSPNNIWQINTKVILLVIVGLSLFACTSQEISVTPISKQLLTATQISNRNTLQPTLTPILTETPQLTFTPTITATADIITALASEFNIPAVCLFRYQISKDNNWIGADCNINRELIIVEKTSNTKYTIGYSEVYDGDTSSFITIPLSWSSDNDFFYFTTSIRCCVDDIRFEENGSLYRFNIKNNNWDILVHAVDSPYYFFTEDGNRYIYFNQHPYDILEIGMVDTITRKNKRVILEGYTLESPNYKWSSNMNKFAVTLWELQFRNGTPGDVILLIDFSKMDMEVYTDSSFNNLLGEE